MQIFKTPGWFKAVIISFLLSTIFLSKVMAQEPILPDNPLRGARVFEQKSCIKCHAINGDGGSLATDLGKEQFHGGYLELASLMWNHFPHMKTAIIELGDDIPIFTLREIGDLFAYLFYVTYLGEPGDEKHGKELLSQKGCLKCHVENGKQNPSVPDLTNMIFYGSPLYLAQAMWNHGPQMQRQMAKSGMKRPRLNGAEMTDLAAYLQSLSSGGFRERVYMQPGNPKTGMQVFRNKRCDYCHSVDEMLPSRKTAPDLSRNTNFPSVTQIAGAMWNHGADMMVSMKTLDISWPEFTGQEMADLISYIFFLRFSNPLGDETKGKEIYVDKKCSRCHSLPEESRSAGKYPIPPAESPLTVVMLMWNHAPRMDSLMAETGISWPNFDLAEMTDLYSFLKSASTEP